LGLLILQELQSSEIIAALGTDAALICGFRKLSLVGFQGAWNTDGISTIVMLPTALVV
jgi:hypothetical protein